MTRTLPLRQVIRRSMIFSLFLLFPIVQNYMSPYLIIDGAFQGIVSGSAVLFGLLFLSSLVLGRAWCGWLCPGGGLMEATMFVKDKKASQKGNWVKWLVWVPWLAIILLGYFSAGGIQQVDVLHKTETGFTLTDLRSYITYYVVVILIFGMSLAFGNRALCHYGCWMAPFMMIGRKLRNLVRWPSLRLQAKTEQCSDCRQCVRFCPMSLDVNAMVKKGDMEHSECILCGNCVDTCKNDVISYKF
jgi:ferredoxin-type protein NapH